MRSEGSTVMPAATTGTTTMTTMTTLTTLTTSPLHGGRPRPVSPPRTPRLNNPHPHHDDDSNNNNNNNNNDAASSEAWSAAVGGEGSASAITTANMTTMTWHNNTTTLGGLKIGSKEFAMKITQSLSSGDGSIDQDQHRRLQKALQDQNFTINKLNLVDLELYGRDAELAILTDAYDQIATATTSAATNTNTNTNNTVTKSVAVPSPGGAGKECPTRLVAILGRAGTGKTRLVQEFQRTIVEQRGGLFLRGKFELHNRSITITTTSTSTSGHNHHHPSLVASGGGGGEPYSAIVTALSDLPRKVASRGSAHRLRIRQRVRDSIGTEGHRLLTSLVPELASLVGFDEQGGSSGESSIGDGDEDAAIVAAMAAGVPTDKELCHEADPGQHDPNDVYTTRSNRLQYVFRQLFAALGSTDHPVVLVLDDVQWCDGPSLSLLVSLASDPDLPNVLLVTAAREEELSESHSFVLQLQTLQEQRPGSIRTIPMGSLDQSAVLSIVSTVLRSSEEKTFQLSEIAHQKSNGNALYVIQFLTSLYDEGLLKYNLGLLQWTWEESKVRARFVMDNVVDLTAAKIQRLPYPLQRVIQVAACLGQTFDRDHLECIVREPRVRQALATNHIDCFEEKVVAIDTGDRNDNVNDEPNNRPADDGDQAWPSDLSACLEALLDEAVIDYIPQLGCYCFVHDLIQDAAFHLVPEENRLRLQSEVGRRLLRFRDDGETCRSPRLSDQYYFRAVDLSNAGVDFLDGPEKRALADHNRAAGTKAMEQAAFAAALRYMEHGQRCLGPGGWSDHPQLALALASGAVEASYCCGDFESMESHMASVLKRDIPVEDKVRVYLTRILSYGAQDQNAKALATGRKVLLRMGMTRLPKRPGLRHVVLELVKTKFLLRRHTESTLLALPLLTNDRWLQAMSVVDMMNAIAYCTDINFFAVMTLRMLRWVVTHGVCQYAPTVFSTYGIILCGLGELQAARMFGNVAMTLSERLNARSSLAKTILGVYGLNVHCTTNLRFCLKPLLYGHKLGMETGEVEIAMYNLSQNGEAQLVTAASPLKALVPKMRANTNLMRDYNQEGVRSFQLLALQFALKLIGPASRPSVLTGAVVDEEEARANAREIGNKVLASFLENYCLQLAYYFEDYELADKYSRATQDFTKVAGGHFMITRNLFFRGLTALALAGEGTSRRRNLSTAAAITRQLDKWSESGNINCIHLVQLLQAEAASVRNSGPDAIRLYWKAINSASRNGYLNDKALAHERAFLFHLRTDPGDLFWAQSHYNDAVQAYCDWNAFQKARHLVKRYGSRFDTGTISNFTIPTSNDYDEDIESMIS